MLRNQISREIYRNGWDRSVDIAPNILRVETFRQPSEICATSEGELITLQPADTPLEQRSRDKMLVV